MVSRKCVKPCSITSSSRVEPTCKPNLRQPSATSRPVISGKDHRPPQIPGLGRRSSSTCPPYRSTSQVVLLEGTAFFSRGAGSSAVRPFLSATQLLLTGQALQRGLPLVQSVAPRSIRACV